MSSLTFKAFIDGVHFDPKKGVIKINLIAPSRMSMDQLITLAPSDETIQVRLESEQTKFDGLPLTSDAQVSFTLDKDALEPLKDAEMELRKAQPFKSTGKADENPTGPRDNLEEEEEEEIDGDQEDKK